MAEFGRRGIAYTPFFAEGMEDIGQAMGVRRERQEEADINKLAQAGWMGDMEAIQELAALDPELAATVEQGSAERQDRETQRTADADKRFVDDLDTAMAQIGAFETYEEAQGFGQRITDMLQKKYPERMPGRGAPVEFTEDYYNEIRTITGGAHRGKPVGVPFRSPNPTGKGGAIMMQQVQLPNGRRIAEPLKNAEGQTVLAAEYSAQLAYDKSHATRMGTEQATIDLADESALAKLSAEAKTTIMPMRSNTMKSIGVIEAMRNHPGLDSVVGIGWLNPAKFVPGTDAHNFQVMADQAKGIVFSSAYETLKGGGPITEFESQKAGQAIARMEQSQSKQEYLRALDDFEAAVREGYRLKLAEARGEFVAEDIPGELPDGDPGASEATAIDATTLSAKPPAGTWVRFPDGSVRQM